MSASTGGTGFSAAAAENDADTVFMTLLEHTKAEGRPVSALATAPNYAPKLFAKHPNREGFSKRDFDAAMQRLFASKRIVNAEYGRDHGKGRARKIVPAGSKEGGADG